MAHFAKLDDNNVVLEINVVNNDAIDSNNEEISGIEFLTQWSNGHTNWKQTSYNGKFRKNYASIGGYYDEDLDAFIDPKPYPSWILDLKTCAWKPPVEKPNDGNVYFWNEETLTWDEAVSL